MDPVIREEINNADYPVQRLQGEILIHKQELLDLLRAEPAKYQKSIDHFTTGTNLRDLTNYSDLPTPIQKNLGLLYKVRAAGTTYSANTTPGWIMAKSAKLWHGRNAYAQYTTREGNPIHDLLDEIYMKSRWLDQLALSGVGGRRKTRRRSKKRRSTRRS